MATKRSTGPALGSSTFEKVFHLLQFSLVVAVKLGDGSSVWLGRYVGAFLWILGGDRPHMQECQWFKRSLSDIARREASSALALTFLIALEPPIAISSTIRIQVVLERSTSNPPNAKNVLPPFSWTRTTSMHFSLCKGRGRGLAAGGRGVCDEDFVRTFGFASRNRGRGARWRRWWRCGRKRMHPTATTGRPRAWFRFAPPFPLRPPFF